MKRVVVRVFVMVVVEVTVAGELAFSEEMEHKTY